MLRWAVYFFLLSFSPLRLYVNFIVITITLITYLSFSSSSSSSLEEELLCFSAENGLVRGRNLTTQFFGYWALPTVTESHLNLVWPIPLYAPWQLNRFCRV